jgi:multidrug efflux pump subunit AcrA (membrane-fusion protein)
MKKTTVLAAAMILTALSSCALTWAEAGPGLDMDTQDWWNANDPRIVTGPSMPSMESRASFEGNSEGSAVIKDVLVKPGDVVKTGDILMTEDSSVAEAERDAAQVAAEAVSAENKAQVQIDVNSKLVERYTNLGDSADPLDLLRSQMDRDVAKADLLKAQEDHEQAQAEYQRQLLRVQHMTLRSRIDGIVKEVNLHPGEAVDMNAEKSGACYIVCNDPLWIEVTPPARMTAKLKLGDLVDVAFTDQPNQWHQAKVIFLDPMVEYTGQLQRMRISMPNPDQRPSGLDMVVRLPEKVVGDQTGAVGTNNPTAGLANQSAGLSNP